MEPPSKTCTKCGKTLPATVEFFERHKEGRDVLRAQCKECRRAAKSAYRRAHPEQAREYERSYRERLGVDERRRRQRLYQRRWRERHPDEAAKNLERLKQWQADNAEYCAEKSRIQARRYYADHLGERKAAMLRWQHDHPDQVRVYRHNRRARKLAAQGTHTQGDIQAQYKRQRGRCYYGKQINPECADSLDDGYHVDHVVPLAGERQSSNGPENLVLTCPNCNQRKSNKDPMDWCGRMF